MNIAQLYITHNSADTELVISQARNSEKEITIFTIEEESLNKENVINLKSRFEVKLDKNETRIVILRYLKIPYTSWQSLLKFFEEPTQGLTYIIEVPFHFFIPDTIRSRAIEMRDVHSVSVLDYEVEIWINASSYVSRIEQIKNSFFEKIPPSIFLLRARTQIDKYLDVNFLHELEKLIIKITERETHKPIYDFQFKDWYMYLSLKTPLLNKIK